MSRNRYYVTLALGWGAVGPQWGLVGSGPMGAPRSPQRGGALQGKPTDIKIRYLLKILGEKISCT
jgi:hypothetical protein